MSQIIDNRISPPTGTDASVGQACADDSVAQCSQWIDTDTLFGTQRELVIRHRDAHYLLRITRNDKLILTK